jgi:hypothetical protein
VRAPEPGQTVGWLLAASWLLLARGAGAETYPGGTRLSYTLGPGTASCVDEEGFRDTVAAQLDGGDWFTPDGAWRFAVTITRRKGGFKGEITLHDGEGVSRGRADLAARKCDAIVNDIASYLATALIPVLRERARKPAAQPEPQTALQLPPQAPQPAPQAVPQPPRAAPKAARTAPMAVSPLPPPVQPRLELGAGLLVAQGFAPDVSVGFSGFLGVRWPATSLLVEARGDLPVATQVQSRVSVVPA